MPQLLLAHGMGMIDLVPEDEERDFLQFLHGQQGVKFGLGFGKAFDILGVD